MSTARATHPYQVGKLVFFAFSQSAVALCEAPRHSKRSLQRLRQEMADQQEFFFAPLSDLLTGHLACLDLLALLFSPLLHPNEKKSVLVFQLQCVRCLLLLLIFELSLIGSAEAPSPLSPLCLARVHLLFTHLPVHAPPTPTPTPRPFTARRSHRRRHASTSCPLCVLPSDNRRCQSVNHFRSPLRRCTFPFWLSFSLGTDNSWRKLSFTCLLCQPLSSLSSVSHSLSLTFPLSSHRFLYLFSHIFTFRYF